MPARIDGGIRCPCCVIVWSDIAPYHAARSKAAFEISSLSVGTIEILDRAGFSEFRASLAESLAFPLERLGLAPHLRSEAVERSLHNVLTRLDPEVVVVPGWAMIGSLLAITWARQRGKRVVVMSDSQAIDAPRSGIRESIKSRVVRTCDAALVAGRRHQDYIVSLGMPENRVFLGYDVVDSAHFEQGADAARVEAAATRAQHGLPERYLLASGRFVSKKNLPRLVEAYAKASSGLSNAPDLVILGDGPERSAIEAAIARSEVAKRVHLQGFRGYGLLPAFYGLAEGFVHVSTSEQWGLVINEAAAAGLPLVVSEPCGAAPELLREGENGFLVNPKDVDDIARALRHLITLPAEARARLSAASQRIIADWGPKRFAEGLMNACEAALAQPPRRLAPWDSVLIRALARREIKDVA